MEWSTLEPSAAHNVNNSITMSNSGWRFFSGLGEKPLFLAPMAEVNDLAFRILCRRHGIKACYTGMLNALQWIQGKKYQNRVFTTCPTDHPLIAQLAGSDFDAIESSAQSLQDQCDAIDLNLGCTQHIARRGEYGFFMVDTEEKRASVLDLVQKLATNLRIPVTAKIRIFQDADGNPDQTVTVEFAKALERAGVSVISIHGRAQHRDKQAEVVTAIIKSVVEAVKIPVIANGGVKSREDADALFSETGAAGVMIGQALLKDPTTFDPNGRLSRRAFALEYLEIVREFPDYHFFYVRKHMFTFFEDKLREDPGAEERIKNAATVDAMIECVNYFTQSE